ncbi:MAG TPA: (2Fe-2S) ferredoxin domain-containing protein [Bacteroidia bacterium]|nr:(2Fe-2S) ferredoxin domain-containing protein [Bacteroidia bacterium]
MSKPVFEKHLFVCTNQRSGTDRRSCGEQHGLDLTAAFKKAIKDKKLDMPIRAQRAGCLGICDFGPTVAIYPEGTFYVNVQLSDVEEIVQKHIIENKTVERLLLASQK